MMIGLCGYGGAGKDEVAKILVKNFGFRRFAFADKLKMIASEIGWDGNKDERGRQLLEDLGYAIRSHLDESALIRAAFTGHTSRNIVITDVRYPNELRLVAGSGVVWRVDRPGVGAVNNHVSETAWNDWTPDAVIGNAGSVADLRLEVFKAMGMVGKG